MHGFIHAVAVPRGKLKNVCDICKAETSETLAAHKMVHAHLYEAKLFMKLFYDCCRLKRIEIIYFNFNRDTMSKMD